MIQPKQTAYLASGAFVRRVLGSGRGHVHFLVAGQLGRVLEDVPAHLALGLLLAGAGAAAIRWGGEAGGVLFQSGRCFKNLLQEKLNQFDDDIILM